jgi:hypothetical protein
VAVAVRVLERVLPFAVGAANMPALLQLLSSRVHLYLSLARSVWS